MKEGLTVISKATCLCFPNLRPTPTKKEKRGEKKKKPKNISQPPPEKIQKKAAATHSHVELFAPIAIPICER